VIGDYIIGNQVGLMVQYVYHELKTGIINRLLVANQRQFETNGWTAGMYDHEQKASL
jgi:hypothetical protein